MIGNCRKCDVTLTDSNSKKYRVNNCNYICNDCYNVVRKINDKKYFNKNRDKIKEYQQKYRATNSLMLKEKGLKYRENRKEEKQKYDSNYYVLHERRIKSKSKEYRDINKNNLEYKANRCKHCANRRSLKHNCTLIGYDLELLKIYKQCKIIEVKMKNKYNVDHIYPLKHKKFCGLHVPWNLQIITKDENLKKGNKNPELFYNLIFDDINSKMKNNESLGER